MVKALIDVKNGKEMINKNIYGHFIEFMGKCINEGIWVGKNSPIPNINGIREDIIEPLRKIKVPVLRWPGGCYADIYNWKDGIGPQEKRPKRINIAWGGVLEDNHFGTHEFLEFCEMIDCEPYINCNVGSGNAREIMEWIEYLNCDKDSEIANIRKRNGRQEPWNVKYVGIGNENWGCGGFMSPEYYTSLYKQYQRYVYNYGGKEIYKIAEGPSKPTTKRLKLFVHDAKEWVEVLMREAKQHINGLAVHYYVIPGPDFMGKKGFATGFKENEWFSAIKKAMDIEDFITDTVSIMDKYDQDEKVDLIIDEWGTIYECGYEKGDKSFFGYDPELMAFQQNTIRDALISAIMLNIFNNHCDRIHMTNLAQMINQALSIILTEGENMILTPTYHVFDLYKVHQNAINLPVNLTNSDYEFENEKIPRISISASRDPENNVNISVCNVDPKNPEKMDFEINGIKINRISGSCLKGDEIDDHNSFENPDKLVPHDINGIEITDEGFSAVLDPMSISVFKVS